MNQHQRSPITTHVLNTCTGTPASGISVSLYIQSSKDNTLGSWTHLSSGVTDKDGRCSNILPQDYKLTQGIYKFLFSAEEYFTKNNLGSSFYPYIEIIFKVTSIDQHYHVPVLLSNYGYTTYRGT